MNTDGLADLVDQFVAAEDPSILLPRVQHLFIQLLKSGELQGIQDCTPEDEHKANLLNCYETVWNHIVQCFNHTPSKAVKFVHSALQLLMCEIANPLVERTCRTKFVQTPRCELLLSHLLPHANAHHMIDVFGEYLVSSNDLRFNMWDTMRHRTERTNPSKTFIMNFLSILGKMRVVEGEDNDENVTVEPSTLNYDENVTKKNMNKIWEHILVQWTCSGEAEKLLLTVLLDHAIPDLEQPLLATNLFMTSVEKGGEIGVLGLQGILMLMQLCNFTYPKCYEKLYEMLQQEMFYESYKVRLIVLVDTFLHSTQMSEMIAAAFVKRLARLALYAPSNDVPVMCGLIRNLIVGHRGLEFMLHNTIKTVINDDPFLMEELDPLKSNAMKSSLWELKSLQKHAQPETVAIIRFIDDPLKTTECDILALLNSSLDGSFDNAMKRKYNQVRCALAIKEGLYQPYRGITSLYWQWK